jgi:hypothetical protein
MHDNALPERDITDYFLAAKRVAAAGAICQKIVNAFDYNRVFAQTDKFFNGFYAAFNTRFLFLFRVEFGKFFRP